MFLSVCFYSQISKLRTTELSYRSKQNNQWTQWSKWEDVSALVSIIVHDKRIVIESKKTQIYDVLDISIKNNGQKIEYYCMDDEGYRCIIKLESTARQIVVMYNDWQHVYKAYFLN